MDLKYIIVVVVMWLPQVGLTQSNHYFTLNNVKARPLAMGGAFISVVDDIASVQYNPAAFSLYNANTPQRFTFFLNPVSPVFAALKKDDLYTGNGAPVDDLLLSLGLFMKAVTFSQKSLQVGIILGEESLDRPQNIQRVRFINARGYRQNHSHTIFGNVNFGDRVALGGAVNIYYRSAPDLPQNSRNKWGISYGVLLKPERGLRVGVAFHNLPDSLQQVRSPLESIIDESINVGISYTLVTGTTVSMDVRNLGEEQNKAIREFHFGVEQTLLSQLALRGGFFKGDFGKEVFSAGIGLLNGNTFYSFDNQFFHQNFWINYAIVYERSNLSDDTISHFFSFIFRI